MAIVRVDVRDQYGTGDIWVDADNAGAAAEEVLRWCEAHPPWVLSSRETARGGDGRYKLTVERAYQV